MDNRERYKPFRRTTAQDGLRTLMEQLMLQYTPQRQPFFLCIGTDRSSGDAFGPLLGSYLTEAGYASVIGTLAYPCDSSNLAERVTELPQNRVVIAVDAGLARPDAVGKFQVANQPLNPGRSMNKKIPPVGDFSIVGFVNQTGNNSYHILQHTSLHVVRTMAKQLASVIMETIPRAAKIRLNDSGERDGD